MKKIFIRPRAVLDLDEQAMFIAQDNQQAACQLYAACEQTMARLVQMPHMGQEYQTTNKQLAGIRFSR